MQVQKRVAESAQVLEAGTYDGIFMSIAPARHGGERKVPWP